MVHAAKQTTAEVFGPAPGQENPGEYLRTTPGALSITGFSLE